MMKSELIKSILETVENDKTCSKEDEKPESSFKEPDKRKKSLVRTLTKHLRMTNKKTGIPKVKTGTWFSGTPDLNFKSPNLV